MRLHWLLPNIKGIPVLMYHRIWPGQQDGLTLTPEQLREQWTYLQSEGYTVLSLQDFLAIARGERPAPPKAVLLTFDDGYRNNLTHAYPLLLELGWCATIFVIGHTLDGQAPPEPEAVNEKLTVAELRSLDPQVVQLALHGYAHENFSKHSVEDLDRIMHQSYEAFRQAGIPFEPVLAYPYGARPKDEAVLRAMKAQFKKGGLQAAFRIGNKPQRLPAADLYELKRIDIRGEDTLDDFRIKLRKGKLRPF